jgi:hypothetical protein
VQVQIYTPAIIASSINPISCQRRNPDEMHTFPKVTILSGVGQKPFSLSHMNNALCASQKRWTKNKTAPQIHHSFPDREMGIWEIKATLSATNYSSPSAWSTKEWVLLWPGRTFGLFCQQVLCPSTLNPRQSVTKEMFVCATRIKCIYIYTTKARRGI